MILFGFGWGGDWHFDMDLVVRCSLVLGVAWLSTMILRRGSAAMRHLVWSATIVGVLALPVAQGLVPSWRVLPTTSQFTSTDSGARGETDNPSEPPSGVVVGDRAELLFTAVDADLDLAWGNTTSTEPTSVAMQSQNNGPADSDTIAIQSREAVYPELAVSETAGGGPVPQSGLSANPNTTSRFTGVSILSLARSLWLAGTVVCCLPVILGLLSVSRLRRSSQPAPGALREEVEQFASAFGVSRRIEVLLSDKRDMPMTWGLFTPVLLLPMAAVSWTVARRRMVLLHEFAHIKRWDCLTQLLGQFTRALHWFNPLAWIALNQLRIEQERACDDFVLNCGTGAEDYAAELLAVTARLPQTTWDSAVALAMSRTTRIEQRLHAILDSDCERRPLSPWRALSMLALMSTLALGIAAVQPRAALAETPLASTVEHVTPVALAQVATEQGGKKFEAAFDNGDFEGAPQPNGLPPSWHAAYLKDTVKFVRLALDEVGHGGKKSVSISIDKAHPAQRVSYNWFTQPRGWKAGDALEFSVWVKTENVNTTPVLALQCLSKDRKPLAFATSEEKFPVTGTKDWTRISTLLLVPADTDKVFVRAALAMPGNAGAKVGFDDFAIAEANAADAKAATKLPPAVAAEPPKKPEPTAKSLTSLPDDSMKKVMDRITEASATPFDTKALNEAAIQGMLQSLKDPYSTLITPDQMKDLYQQLEGKLAGVGASLAKEADEIVVLSLIPNSPATRGGLKPRDVIVEINGQAIKELGEVVKAIRGPAGTDVTLKIRRADKVESLTLKRDAIRMPSVKGFGIDDQGQWRHWLDIEQKVAYVHINQFDQETPTMLNNTLTGLHDQGIKGLVLDLRGNVGGLLKSCVDVASLVLKSGTVVETRGRQPDQNSIYRVTESQNSRFTELPLVVLIDPSTASAGEILAAALKDNKRAILIGERTFGKGSVQSILPLGDDGWSLKLTTAQMFSPSGQSLNRTPDSKSWGIDPDEGYYVPLKAEQRIARQKAQFDRESGSSQLPPTLSPDFIETTASDPQLAAALKTVLAKLKSGEYIKTGRPLAEQQIQLTQREELRKQRDELRAKLEQLDRELGDRR